MLVWAVYAELSRTARDSPACLPPTESISYSKARVSVRCQVRIRVSVRKSRTRIRLGQGRPGIQD